MKLAGGGRSVMSHLDAMAVSPHGGRAETTIDLRIGELARPAGYGPDHNARCFENGSVARDH